MDDSSESVVRSFLEAWKEPQVDRLISFISDDAVYTDGPRGVHEGPDAIRSELEAQIATGFKYLALDIKSLVADDRTVMMEREDTFSIAGKPFSMELMAIIHVGPDGRISRWREYYDLKTITDKVESSGSSHGTEMCDSNAPLLRVVPHAG